MSPESIGFDRAVEYYDRTRALPDDVVVRQRDILHRELAGAERVLEIGIGTGRIAVTLDVPIIGVDLSRLMMEVLRGKTNAIPLVQGDATRLPFPDGRFDAGYAAHVFHLIPAWETALAELARVVRPGGVVLAVRGSGATDIGHALRRRFEQAVGTPVRIVGAATIDDVDDGARRLGLRVRVLPTLTVTETRRLGAFVDELANGTWAGIWDLPDDVRRRGADAVAQSIVDEHGSLDAEVEAKASFAWHAYDVP